MSYQTEFPDFKPADMPAIPAGFADSSWHNDACPRFENEQLGLTLWVDYLDPAERETAGRRFLLCTEQTETIAESDSMREIVAAIDSFVFDMQAKCSHRDTGRGVCADCGKFL